MTAIIRPAFHYSIAESIYEKIQAETSLYYYFIGRVDPWSEDESETLSFPEPINSQQFENEARKNMVTLKQITIQDIALCTRRINWTSGTVYDPYDDTDINLGSKNFYVVTDEFNVYKCLSNNYDGESTVKPTGLGNTVNGIPFSPFETGDGYIWKFLFTIPLILQNKFLVSGYIPVPRQAKNQFYSAGVIENVTINNGGSGYHPTTTSATVIGDGVGASATLQITVPEGEEVGVITEVVIGGDSESATITNAVGDGDYVVYTTDNPHTFTTDQRVTITGIVPSSFNITTPAEIVSVTSDTFTVSSTNEDTYTSGGSVTAAYPDGGIGYTTATLNVTDTDVGSPGSGADITLNLSSPGDLDTQQADIETYAIDGGLSYIIVTNGSGGYTSAPTVTISGDGSGAAATAYIDGTGKVTSIEITDYGSGYTYATATLSSEAISGGTAAATARVIVSPFGGHGRNAPRELFADTLCLYSSFDNVLNHNDIAINHDYRQFGIVSNIREFDSLTKYNTATGTAGYKLEGSFDAEEFEADEIIYTSGHAKELQVITSLDNKMLVISLNGSIPIVGDEFTNGTSSFTITALTEPNVDKYSGEILFIDNQVPFSATAEQEISFRSFIKL